MKLTPDDCRDSLFSSLTDLIHCELAMNNVLLAHLIIQLKLLTISLSCIMSDDHIMECIFRVKC